MKRKTTLNETESYCIEVADIRGNAHKLEQYRGNVLPIVNDANK